MIHKTSLVINDFMSKTISLIEAKPLEGECKNCKKKELCNGFWRKDVEEKGAICVMRGYKNYLPLHHRITMHDEHTMQNEYSLEDYLDNYGGNNE